MTRRGQRTAFPFNTGPRDLEMDDLIIRILDWRCQVKRTPLTGATSKPKDPMVGTRGYAKVFPRVKRSTIRQSLSGLSEERNGTLWAWMGMWWRSVSSHSDQWEDFCWVGDGHACKAPEA